MTDKKDDEGIEFILQHWDLVSPEKKKILESLGISPTHKSSYQTNDYYSLPHDHYRRPEGQET